MDPQDFLAEPLLSEFLDALDEAGVLVDHVDNSLRARRGELHARLTRGGARGRTSVEDGRSAARIM